MSDARVTRSLPTTVDEFLVWPGDGWGKRCELVEGEVRAMSPASAVHGILQLTLGSLIRQHLRDSGGRCKVLTEPAVKPRLRADINLRVPDIGVTCSPIAAGQIIIEEPILLVEILSPSNRAETWTNVWAYTTIPSLREIVIVRSDRLEIQVLRSSPDHIWPDNPETVEAEGTLRLESIGLACPIEDVYADTPLVET